MRRRDFIAALGGVAAFPLAAGAQQAMPVVGFISSQSSNTPGAQLAALHDGLKDQGFVEGQNIRIEYRWADNQYDRLPSLAGDLVNHRVAVIVAAGGDVTALAAQHATALTPIVFTAVSDPVKIGLVKSLNKPGGNVTGIAALTIELDVKRFGLLREIAPNANVIGFLVNRHRNNSDAQIQSVQAAAQATGAQLVVLNGSSEHELELAFAALAEKNVRALLIAADPIFNSQRKQIMDLLVRNPMPAVYQFREFALSGLLMTYGPNLPAAYRQTGVYAGRILKGEKPADLPVIQPTKFDFVINLKTARTLGITVPLTLQATADEVIE